MGHEVKGANAFILLKASPLPIDVMTMNSFNLTDNGAIKQKTRK